jgi:hypothetical protein
MSPFEALYGRKCTTPLMWSKVGERLFFVLAVIKDAKEQVAKVRENLKIAQTSRRAMLIKEEEILVSELVITCISRCHPLEAP